MFKGTTALQSDGISSKEPSVHKKIEWEMQCVLNEEHSDRRQEQHTHLAIRQHKACLLPCNANLQVCMPLQLLWCSSVQCHTPSPQLHACAIRLLPPHTKWSLKSLSWPLYPDFAGHWYSNFPSTQYETFKAIKALASTRRKQWTQHNARAQNFIYWYS